MLHAGDGLGRRSARGLTATTMVNSLIRRAISILMAVGLATAIAADTPPDASTVIVGTPAVLLTRSAPEYPRSEVIHQKEGWLLVSYDITAEGQVSDIVILDQVGPKPFADAAIKALKAWTFKPATFQREPAAQLNNLQSFVFRFSDGMFGIDYQRGREFKKLLELVNGKDDPAAQALIDRLLDLPLNIYELTVLNVQRATLARRAQQFDDEVAFQQRALMGSGILGDKMNASLLGNLFIAQVRTGKVADALATYQKMIPLASALPNWSGFEAVHRDLVAAQTSNQPLSTRGAIRRVQWSEDFVWTHHLLRRSIEFSEVQGTLRRFQVRCERKVVGDQVLAGKNWTVPAGWGQCTLYVYGDPGATFMVTEFADVTQ